MIHYFNDYDYDDDDGFCGRDTYTNLWTRDKDGREE